ncbi:MAG: heavy-metal-associated domain-containing protein [Planctomycetes bacterium]|nr:heavy-metal-associated domain-containing protein [Planctomycetota bacterium]
MKRSVERVDGVKEMQFDMSTGQASVSFQPGKTPAPADLWRATKESGFTPVKIESAGTVYEGPNR